jgi:hypothetical protein
MEIFVAAFALLVFFLSFFLLKKVKPNLRFILNLAAGLLLIALVWLVKADGSSFWKILITVIVVWTIYERTKIWHSLWKKA